MAAYRPLLILAGIWGVLLTIAVVAYDHLLYTAQDSPQARSSTSEITIYPHQRLQGDRGNPSPTPTAVAPDAAANLPSSQDPEVPTTSSATAPEASEEDTPSASAVISPGYLAALVLACALGCLMLSRQLQAPPRPPRQPRKRMLKSRQPLPKPPVSGRSAREAAAKSSPQRLAPYNPNQPFVSVPAQPKAPQAAREAASSKPTTSVAEVTVVPDEAQHPLDWSKDSLINTVDVRQRRSLSSFL